MRYNLVLVPEEEKISGASRRVGVLPEGTHTLDVIAHWQVTGDDGKFKGGSVNFKYPVILEAGK